MTDLSSLDAAGLATYHGQLLVAPTMEAKGAAALASWESRMLKVFEVIGPRSPQADEYRNRLQSMLY